jgi:hypothetical protein
MVYYGHESLLTRSAAARVTSCRSRTHASGDCEDVCDLRRDHQAVSQATPRDRSRRAQSDSGSSCHQRSSAAGGPERAVRSPSRCQIGRPLPPSAAFLIGTEEKERNADMKNAVKRDTRKGFIFQQCMRVASRIRHPRGRHHMAPAPFPVMPEHVWSVRAMLAVLLLALLLFSLPGITGVITSTYALTPNQLSVSSLATRPTKTPPPRHSPTPRTVPSPTAPATTMATVPAGAVPPAKATTQPTVRQPGASQMHRSVATPSTRSTSSAVQHPFRVQQKGEVGFSPLVRGILIGIATVVLLVAVGLLLLLKWLMPVKWVKLPPSSANSWQRVRPTSLHGNMNSSSDSTQ